MPAHDIYFVAKVKEKKMANKKVKLGMLAMALAFGFVFAGCESMGDIFTGISAGYSATSEEGLTYTFYNNSSYTVTCSDSTASMQIPSGGTASAIFNSSASIYDVTYSPEDRVSVSISGTSVIFRNR